MTTFSQQSNALRGDVMMWNFQMDAWAVLVLPNGIPVIDRRLKIGITAEKLFQRGMPQEQIGPHFCPIAIVRAGTRVTTCKNGLPCSRMR